MAVSLCRTQRLRGEAREVHFLRSLRPPCHLDALVRLFAGGTANHAGVLILGDTWIPFALPVTIPQNHGYQWLRRAQFNYNYPGCSMVINGYTVRSLGVQLCSQTHG